MNLLALTAAASYSKQCSDKDNYYPSCRENSFYHGRTVKPVATRKKAGQIFASVNSTPSTGVAEHGSRSACAASH